MVTTCYQVSLALYNKCLTFFLQRLKLDHNRSNISIYLKFVQHVLFIYDDVLNNHVLCLYLMAYIFIFTNESLKLAQNNCQLGYLLPMSPYMQTQLLYTPSTLAEILGTHNCKPTSMQPYLKATPLKSSMPKYKFTPI